MINSRDALFDFFDVGESVFGWSRWRGVCETDQLTVRMFTSRWRTREGLDLIANDVIYVAFSTTFVYLYLALHFRSLLLATLGMLQILMSLPIALLFYPFRFIREHLIAIFLSLGVGADDLFVFLHAWQQASRREECQGTGLAALVCRMEVTYGHTASMVLATSITTAVSFLGTAISPIFSIASLGMYAALCILSNWLLTVTFWPATMALHRRASVWLAAKCASKCPCCCSCTRPTGAGDARGWDRSHATSTRASPAGERPRGGVGLEMTDAIASRPLSPMGSPRPSFSTLPGLEAPPCASASPSRGASPRSYGWFGTSPKGTPRASISPNDTTAPPAVPTLGLTNLPSNEVRLRDPTAGASATERSDRESDRAHPGRVSERGPSSPTASYGPSVTSQSDDPSGGARASSADAAAGGSPVDTSHSDNRVDLSAFGGMLRSIISPQPSARNPEPATQSPPLPLRLANLPGASRCGGEGGESARSDTTIGTLNTAIIDAVTSDERGSMPAPTGRGGGVAVMRELRADGDGVATKGVQERSRVERMSFIEAFFARAYAPLIEWSPKGAHGLKPVSLLLLLVLGGFGIWSAHVAMQLKPNLEEINLSFPHDHAFHGIGEHLLDFLASGTSDHASAFLVLGIAGYDRAATGFSTMRPDAEPRGVVQFDTQFDLRDPRAQSALIGLCDALQAAPCVPGGTACLEGFGSLVVPDSVRCALPYFYAHVDANASYYGDLNMRNVSRGSVGGVGARMMPMGDDFETALRTWSNDAEVVTASVAMVDGENAVHSASVLGRDIGFIDGRLRYLRIGFKAPISEVAVFTQPHLVASYYEELDAFVRGYMHDYAPRSLGVCDEWTTTLTTPGGSGDENNGGGDGGKGGGGSGVGDGGSSGGGNGVSARGIYSGNGDGRSGKGGGDGRSGKGGGGSGDRSGKGSGEGRSGKGGGDGGGRDSSRDRVGRGGARGGTPGNATAPGNGTGATDSYGRLITRVQELDTRGPMTRVACSGVIPWMEGPGILGSFAIARTTEYMVTGLMSGLAVSAPATLFVLILATGSPLVSAYAMLTIGMVVASLFAFISTVFGWELGHSEAIAGTIVLGFAIDYCVHLAHAYLTSVEPTCGGKARESVAKMGNTVLAGAVTTVGSGVAMAMCQAQVYHKMGVLICITILFSCLYALLFFAPLCAVLGPTSSPWRIGVVVDGWVSWCVGFRKERDVGPEVGRPVSLSSPRSPRPPLARVNPMPTRV